MQRVNSISLLFLLLVSAFPWRLICIAHPFGHSQVHHEAGKLSPCELRKQYKGKGPAYFPPMHCHHTFSDIGNYQLPVKFQIKPPQQALAILMVMVEHKTISIPKDTYFLSPEPRCRSAPIIASNTLRGPPFC